MVFNGHVFNKAGAIFDVEACSDIIFFLQVFHGSRPELEALFKTTKSHALMFLIKSVRPA